MKKRTIIIGIFILFLVGVISIIGTYAIDSTITEGNSSTADYLFNITLGNRTNREVVIPSYDSKIVDIKISNPNEFAMSYLLYIEGVNSNISVINIKDTEASGVLASKTVGIIQIFIQNNSSSDITIKIKDIVGFAKETLTLPSNSTAINKGTYYKVIVKPNNKSYGKVKQNVKLSTMNGILKYEISANTGYTYKSNTCGGTVSNNILTISNITSNINCEVVFEPNTYKIAYILNNGTSGTNAPTTATYDSVVTINNPTKTVKVTGNANGTGATVGSATSKAQTFAGWTASNLNTSTAYYGTSSSAVSTKWSSGSTKVTAQYFKNLTPTNGATVALTANWTAVAFNLPTVTKTGYTCKWNTKSDGSGSSYNSGASYTPSATSSTAVTMYAVCTANSYTITYSSNGSSNYIIPVNNSISMTGFTGSTNKCFTLGRLCLDGLSVDDTLKMNFNLNYDSITVDTANSYGILPQGSGNSTNWSPGIGFGWNRTDFIGTGNYTFSNSITISTNQLTNDYFSMNLRTDYITAGSMTVSDLKVTKNNSTSESKVYGGTLGTLPSITDIGYTLAGWYTASSGGTKISSSTSVPSQDTTYYAHWNANSYKIAYSLNNGTSGTNAPTTATYDSLVTINNPTKTVTVTGNANGTGATVGSATSKAQTFAGWTASNLNNLRAVYGTSSSAVSTLWSDGSTKVTAQYFKNLTPTNGATVALTANWTAVAFNLPTVTKTGYTCKWNTKSDGSGTSYNSGASYTPNATGSTAITMYAVCTVNKVYINYHVNGGSVTSSTTSDSGTTYNWTTTDSIVYLNGVNLTTSINYGSSTSSSGLPNYNNSKYLNITRTGYYVPDGTEWICSSGCTTASKTYDQDVVYAASDFCDASSSNCTVVLKVNWKPTYTVSYNANGGSGAPSSQTKIDGVNLTLSSTVPTKDGYKFLGWSTSSTATSATYAAGGTYTADSSVTLYAVWKSIYTIPSFTYTGSYKIVDENNSAISSPSTWTGNWKIRFLSSGTFTSTSSIIVDIFAVGGGGGGANGGGCGGYTATKKTVRLQANTAYTVTVGAGGASGGYTGGTSSFASFISAAGGEGPEGSGGSGGGGAGAYITDTNQRSGGNGGSNGGNGGNGYGTSGYRNGYGQGTTTREFGESTGTLYAGGGGGGGGCGYYFALPGDGGAGGGGNGSYAYYNGKPGGTNTGGGGGGGCNSYEQYQGGAGGSGIVIIRNTQFDGNADAPMPTCTLSADATTITATVSTNGDSSIVYQGWSSTYEGDNSSSKSISVGMHTYYVKNEAGNTGECSAKVIATTENCECGAGFPQSGACYIGIIENGKWVGNKYYKECEYTYTCSLGTKINNSYCFKTY